MAKKFERKNEPAPQGPADVNEKKEDAVGRVFMATFTEKGIVLDQHNNATLEEIVLLRNVLQQGTSFESVTNNRLSVLEAQVFGLINLLRNKKIILEGE